MPGDRAQGAALLPGDVEPAPAATAEESTAAVTCPFCGAGEPILVSAFGCHHLVSHYRCRGCWTYFDAIRDDK